MGIRFGKFKCDIGFKIDTYQRNLQIIDIEYRPVTEYAHDRRYISNKKWYKYRCLNCGNEDWIIESSLFYNHSGCNVCCASSTKVLVGYNDINTTAPWMTNLFKERCSAYKYTAQSNKREVFVCPNCGAEKEMRIQDLYRQGYVTCACNDNISYPNKFIYCMLRQLGVKFQSEVKFPWSDNRIYDDYIEYSGLKIITEQHGKQHYEKPIIKSDKYRSVEDEQRNDTYKRNLALCNGIDYYFEIDCRNSTMEYIKNSIVASGLLEILNVAPENINWLSCDEFATSNIVKYVCDYQNSHQDLSLLEISNILHFGYGTIKRYIHQGNKFGWCNYDAETHSKICSKSASKRKRPIYFVEKDMYFSSSPELEKYYSSRDQVFRRTNVHASAQTGKPYKGHHFQFITQEEFNKVKSESPDKVVGDYFHI